MKLFFHAVKTRLLPAAGWTVCSFFSMWVGGMGGLFAVYLCLVAGWAEPTDKLVSGWTTLTMPCIGAVLGLAVMHLVRIRFWIKLHRRYMEAEQGWTRKHTIGIVFIDEMIWLAAFTAIFFALTAIL